MKIKSNLLAFTSIEAFWPTDATFTFAGEWCKLYDRRTIWEKLSHNTLEYHWSDRNRLFRDYSYVQRVIDFYSRSLASLLNEAHHLDMSSRDWKVFLGYYLLYAVPTVYDRYLTIKSAQENGIYGAFSGSYNEYQFTPKSTTESIDKSTLNDTYNQFIYDFVASRVEKFQLFKSDFSLSLPEKEDCIGNPRLKRKLLNFLGGKGNRRYCVYRSPLSHVMTLKLNSYLAEVPFYPYLFDEHLPNSQIEQRRKISLPHFDEFTEILSEFLKSQLPTVFIEGFSQLQSFVDRRLPRKPELILTAHAFAGDDAFCLWAAQSRHRHQTKLVIAQHGGHYGTGKWSSSEEHEIEMADQFLSWGWTDSGKKKIRPMPSAKLSAISKVKSNPSGEILQILCSLPRYSYWMYSIPVADSYLGYVNDQIEFIHALNDQARAKLNLRAGFEDFGWDLKARILNTCEKIKFSDPRQSNLTTALKDCRLFIGTYNATSFLETFAADFPTILFWNPQNWEIRDEAKGDFEALEQAGILHQSGSSAATLVNYIFENPTAWWKTSEVQQAVERFMKKFGNTSSHAHREWAKEIKNIVKEPNSPYA